MIQTSRTLDMPEFSDTWFLETIDRCEHALRSKGVPRRYWGYILANSPPEAPGHDGLGAIYNSRGHFVRSARGTKGDMGVTVIDGRDLETVRKWIGGSDWSEYEEQRWLQAMRDGPTVDDVVKFNRQLMKLAVFNPDDADDLVLEVDPKAFGRRWKTQDHGESMRLSYHICTEISWRKEPSLGEWAFALDSDQLQIAEPAREVPLAPEIISGLEVLFELLLLGGEHGLEDRADLIEELLGKRVLRERNGGDLVYTVGRIPGSTERTAKLQEKFAGKLEAFPVVRALKPKKAINEAQDAIRVFGESGPYTLDDVLRVATLCSKSDFHVGDTIQENIARFSPEELGKLIDYGEKRMKGEERRVWTEGTSGWKLHSFEGDFSAEQLLEIAKRASVFDRVLAEGVDAKGFNMNERLQLLLACSAANSARIARKARKRDASPVRNPRKK